MIKYSDKRTTKSIFYSNALFDVDRTFKKTFKLFGWTLWLSEYEIIGDVSLFKEGKKPIGLQQNEKTN